MTPDLQKELRRYAAAGKRERVLSILQAILEQTPEDVYARAELSRLKKGLPLYAEMSFKKYRSALARCAEDNIKELMARYPAANFSRMDKEKARSLLDTLKKLEQRIKDNKESYPPLRGYRRAIMRSLGLRALREHRKICNWGLIALGGLILLGIANCHMRARALEVGKTMEKALQAENWQRVKVLRSSGDSGINNLLNPALEGIMAKADAWIAHKEQIYREASKLISEIQDGTYTMENLPLAKRAVMERYLRALPPALNDISPKWEELRLESKSQWLKEIPVVMARLIAPLPPLPEMNGAPAVDEKAAALNKIEMEMLLNEYTDLVDAYRLDPALLKPLQERIEKNKRLIDEIRTWQKALRGIDEARTYAEYKAAVEKLDKPRLYARARALVEGHGVFPGEEILHDLMSNPGQKIPPKLLKQARNTLIEGGATFTKDNPASQAQVELLNELLTTRTLKSKLYEISDRNGHVAYSTAPFKREESGFITFKRAELDPHYRIGQSPDEKWLDDGISQRVVDTTGLAKVAKLQHNVFFINTNLPHVLGEVLRFHHPDCPVLAKAYVYNILLRAMHIHERPFLIGAEHSPSLQADARSFFNMTRESGIHLRAGCWLEHSNRHQVAAKEYADWFEKRKDNDYAEEIARHYGRIALVKPLYIGYVDEEGKAVLCKEHPRGEELWFIGPGGMEHGFAGGGRCPKAIPYSPLFIKDKEKTKKQEKNKGE